MMQRKVAEKFENNLAGREICKMSWNASCLSISSMFKSLIMKLKDRLKSKIDLNYCSWKLNHTSLRRRTTLAFVEFIYKRRLLFLCPQPCCADPVRVQSDNCAPLACSNLQLYKQIRFCTNLTLCFVIASCTGAGTDAPCGGTVTFKMGWISHPSWFHFKRRRQGQ